jgi:hypothetical protein
VNDLLALESLLAILVLGSGAGMEDMEEVGASSEMEMEMTSPVLDGVAETVVVGDVMNVEVWASLLLELTGGIGVSTAELVGVDESAVEVVELDSTVEGVAAGVVDEVPACTSDDVISIDDITVLVVSPPAMIVVVEV